MDAVLLARIQFALTVGFHFLFPPLTIGLAWLLVWLVGRYRRTGDEGDRALARFWVRLFAISFAIGVATGIVMEFQFGTNWARYSRYVGDIFGAPLAAEAVFAFFLESVFVAVLILGWNRVSRTTLWVSSWLVVIGSTLSAFWIIVANSWMQTPRGYHEINGRAELTDFWAAVFNPSTLPRYLHTIDASLIVGAFFMMGISAWYLLRDRHAEAAKRAFTAALVVGFLASVGALGLGHWHAVQVEKTQPAKLAAFEGLFETQANAPLTLFGFPDAETRTLRAAVSIPGGLSLLVGNSTRTVVEGLDKTPRADWPPLLATFVSFHLMVLLGLFFIAFTALGLLLLRWRRLFENRLFLKVALWSIPLPFLTTQVGWMAAEIGRQPWAVYGVLRTSDAASNAATVPAGHILASIIMFSLIYLLLFYTWVRLLRKSIGHGITEEALAPVSEVVISN